MVASVLRVHPAAYRHGVSHADIVHAYYHATVYREFDPEAQRGKVLIIGPSTAGNHLELIGSMLNDGRMFVFHAMPLRKIFRHFLIDWTEQ